MATMDKSKVSNNQSHQNTSSESAQTYCIDFHGAAIIDADGNEIAITEEMILNACQSLDNHWPLNPYRRPEQG